MAGSVNKVILVGRVGNEPETRKLGKSNDAPEMAEFSLATSESWRDRNSGERKERTEWHKVKVMNDGIVNNIIRPYVKKGSLLYIEGKLETEKWKDRDGNDRYSTKVVVPNFGGSLHIVGGNGKDDDREDRGSGRRDDRGSSSRSNNSSSQPRSSTDRSSFSRDMDDDIPF